MDGTRFRAGIELYGRVMRYAEVDLGPRKSLAQAGVAPRLVRLGACDFDFDVAEALLDLSGPTHLDTVATAVGEIFDGSGAEALRVAVHPWRATSFFSPLPEGTTPAGSLEQLRQEAAMLSDAPARSVRVRATPVRIETMPDGRRSHWHHVLRLPESVHARFAHLAKPLAAAAGREAAHEFVDTTAAAAAVMARLHPDDEEGEPFALALGAYGDRTEFALCRGTTWYHGHYAEAASHIDGAYFCAAMLDRLGVAPQRVRRLYLYGDAAGPEMVGLVSEFLGREVEPLDPLRVFNLAPPDADPFALTAYAPVIGALLR